MGFLKRAVRSGPIMFAVFVCAVVLTAAAPQAFVVWIIGSWLLVLVMSVVLLVRVFWPNQTPLERQRLIAGGQLSAMPRWLRCWILDDDKDRWGGWFR
jgi:hypothetical protein